MSEGELVIDEFELLNCVATGSYSQIWEVREKGGSQALAMKLLLPEAFADRDQIKVLKHESADAPLFLTRSRLGRINRKPETGHFPIETAQQSAHFQYNRMWRLTAR